MNITVQKVKWLMAELGVSSQALARLMELSPSTLSATLRGVYPDSKREGEALSILNRLLVYRDALAPMALPTSPEQVQKLLDSGKSPEELRDLVNEVFG